MTRLILVLLLALALPARAENPAPYSGTRLVETGLGFETYVDKLLTAARAKGMGIVAQACADCGANSIGVTIPGNRVIMVFRPDFAVRMLGASVAAGIEAPLRLYVTERPDGSAMLSYRLPSHTFAPYDVPTLDAMARELDDLIAAIVAESLK